MNLTAPSRLTLAFTAPVSLLSPSRNRTTPSFFCLRHHSSSPITYDQHKSSISAVASANAKFNDSNKKNIVFLGTPQVAASSLSKLVFHSENNPDSSFRICCVVTQPPAPVGRKRVLTKSPVHQTAEQLSISPILTPEKANDSQFLSTLTSLNPDLCITAAYGNFLPTKFLNIPKFGTLNIHPSLLPKFRGAAPVPRAIEAGVKQTGVSILYTVLKMDAGPIVAQHIRTLHGHEQAPELLTELFDVGTDTLLQILPDVWNEKLVLQQQDDSLASHASKLSKDEARLSFTENALIIHNKVRAFAGWPGAWADFTLTSTSLKDGEPQQVVEEIRLKILHTIVLREEGGMCFGIHDVAYNTEQECLSVTCGDGSIVGVSRVQPPGKKPMDARSFWNGLRGKKLQRKRLPY